MHTIRIKRKRFVEKNAPSFYLVFFVSIDCNKYVLLEMSKKTALKNTKPKTK